jgi:hypothetical protein
LAGLAETGVLESFEFLNAAFELSVIGVTIATYQARIEISWMAGQLDHLTWNVREPANQEERIVDPGWVGDASQPIIAEKRLLGLLPRFALAQE